MFFERLNLKDVEWDRLDAFVDRTIHQTAAWLRFLAETQNCEPVVAALRDNGGETIGYFTGCTFRKFGVKFLGSPFPGWTTSYMGFNLRPEIRRADALGALAEFAFRKLGCIHLELMDKRITEQDAAQHNYAAAQYNGFALDLTKSEEQIFKEMDSACRRCVKKAEKSGVTVEEASDAEFADDYYSQLQDVFAKQRLVPTYSIERVRALVKHLQPTGNLLLLRARDADGRCIGTGIFPAFNDTAYFWGGASWRPAQILRPNEAVQWYAMRYWKQRGITVYDMGGGGGYKKKYGGSEIAHVWIRKSRYSFLEQSRAVGKKVVRLKQQLLGKSLS